MPSIESLLIVFLTLSMAATRPALAQTPATWYRDTNGATANAGSDFLTFNQGTCTLAVVPEPSTFALIAIASLGGLTAALRRRKRHA